MKIICFCTHSFSMAVSSLTADLKNMDLLLSFPGSGVMRGLEGPHLRAATQVSGVCVGGPGSRLRLCSLPAPVAEFISSQPWNSRWLDYSRPAASLLEAHLSRPDPPRVLSLLMNLKSLINP